MSAAGKDTIYIDIEDEITGIIDKIRSSKEKIVALVLPKRATVFHSIVNMKLLKRTIDETKKNVVLITSEAGILPLAGAVGVYVAKTLQSKPAIPSAAALAKNDSDINIVNVNDDNDVSLDKAAPVGALAGLPLDEEDETIEVGGSDSDVSEGDGKATDKKSANKKLKIPNFEKFRVRLFLGILAIALLITGWIFAVMILPKARITIKTDTTGVVTGLTLTASPKAKELDKATSIVPALNKEYKKTDALKAAATGEKNNGTKASGTITLTNCIDDGAAHTIPAGTGFSSGEFTFITNEAVTLEPALYSGSTCKSATFGLSKSVAVTANQGGDKYNLSARSYNSPASLSTANGAVTAAGSAMSGGTSKIVKVVSQSDIDTTKQKILDQNIQTSKDELSKQLKAEGYLPLTETFAAGNPVVTASPNVNEEGAEVNVSIVINYTMLGAKEDAVKQLVEDDVKQHIDITKQTILDNGLSKAAFQILEKRPTGEVKFSLNTEVIAGVQQDTDSIKRAVAGKKRGETQTIIQQRPGVKDVSINYSPFFVFSTPKKLSKITVTFEQVNNDANKP